MGAGCISEQAALAWGRRWGRQNRGGSATAWFCDIVVDSISLSLLISSVLPVFLVMGAGAFLRYRGVLSPMGDGSLLGLTVNVTYPCLILRSMVGNESLNQPENLYVPVLCGAGFIIVSGAAALLAAPLFGMEKGAARRTFAMACSIQNYGYLPIPILHALFPDDRWRGVLFTYTLGIEVVLWTLGVWVMNPASRAISRLWSPVVLSIIGGAVLHFLPLESWMSLHPALELIGHSIARLVSLLADCAVPMGLLVAGLTFCDLMQRPRGDGAFWPVATGSIVMRMVVLPALMVGITMALPAGWVTQDFRNVVAVQAAMPGAIFPMIIARLYGGDEGTALRVVVATTLLSIFSIPPVLQLTLRLCQGE